MKRFRKVYYEGLTPICPIGLIACIYAEFRFAGYDVRNLVLEDMAGSFEDNLIGVGQAFVERPVHSVALAIGTMLMPHIAIPVNIATDRLGDWVGRRGW